MTEDELIRGCLKDDNACQKELFDRFAGRMLGVCNRYARNSADAEDILQDAFIKVFGKIHQFKFEGKPSGGTVFIDNLYFYRASLAPTAPEVAAPTPTLAAANVISIYSDAYTNVGISELNPNWSQTTTLEEVVIEGNNTWKYDLLNYTGIVTSYDNPTDLSTMTHVHFDYWTPDATSLGLKLVNTSYGDGDSLKEDIEFLSTVVNGSWVSVEILLSDFTTDRSGITQLLFESSGATVYIDNLYFHN